MKENEEKITKDIFSDEEFDKEYELYQEYPRFNVYNVYKVYSKTKDKKKEKKFLYRTTKSRTDFGKRLCLKKDLLNELNKKLGEIRDGSESLIQEPIK